MFESAELGHKISKNTFREEEPKLRAALLDAQFDLRENGKFPVVILISGVDGAGKGETINVLYEWMDPRYLSTLAFSAPTDEERERPYMWRFWRALPPKGRAGIFAGSWYSNPIAERIRGELTTGELDQRMDQVNRFEAMLVNEGALVIKFWFHLSKDGQKERLKALEKDPRTAWRVTKESWDRLKTYDKLQEAAGHVLRMTNTPWAPWVVVEGTDDRYRSLTVGKIVLDALQNRLADTRDQNFPVAPPMTRKIDSLDVLSALDLTQRRDTRTARTRAQGRPARHLGPVAQHGERLIVREALHQCAIERQIGRMRVDRRAQIARLQHRRQVARAFVRIGRRREVPLPIQRARIDLAVAKLEQQRGQRVRQQQFAFGTGFHGRRLG